MARRCDMKETIGWCLLGLPFAVVFVGGMVLCDGWKATLIMLGCLGVVIALMAFGLHLIGA